MHIIVGTTSRTLFLRERTPVVTGRDGDAAVIRTGLDDLGKKQFYFSSRD